MKHKIFQRLNIVLYTATAVGVLSCSKGHDDPSPVVTDARPFHIAYAIDPEGQSQTIVQGLDDLTTGNINFTGYGFTLPSSRTARFFASADGKSIYSLDFGGGAVYAFDYKGGQNYTEKNVTNVELALGTKNPRFTKVNADYGLLHNVSATTVAPNGTYERHSVNVRLANLKFDGVQIKETANFEFPYSQTEVDRAEAAAGIYASRIDAPAVVNGKAYYGYARSKYNASTNTTAAIAYEDVATLVVDYPALTNPKIIRTKVNGAKGASNGYRTPTSHVDEKGDIYQIITTAGKSDTHILRIRNGAYDETYSLNLSALLGHKTTANGWFYVEDGIGYVPYANMEPGKGSGSDVAAWGVARIDLYKGTAIAMQGLPEKLWLHQYQWSTARNGKFYMALAPVTGTGNVYIFDYKSTSPTAHAKGATVSAGANAALIGIF
jgi:hypothetical protein